MLIRPKIFKDFIGQPKAVSALQVPVKAAKKLKKQLAHILITGPAGLGKSTLGLSIIPNELDAKAVAVNCASIERPTDLLPMIATVPNGGILFLDEIHALSGTGCYDYLLTVLEEGRILVKGENGNKPTVVTFTPMTIIGATTREGQLPEPLRDRFFHQIKLELYGLEDMAKVVAWTGKQRDIDINDDCAMAIAKACHGTARWAVRLVEALQDTVAADDRAMPTLEDVTATLDRLGFQEGFTQAEQRYMKALHAIERAAGIQTLASVLDEEVDTVTETIEPWLLQQNYVTKTPQGRILSAKGIAYVTGQ